MLKKLHSFRYPLFILIFLCLTLFEIIADDHSSVSLTHRMMLLAFQIGIILLLARFGGIIMKKINMPSVLGELLIGIIIGPTLLGGIPFPGFEQGLFPFPIIEGSIQISPELYGLASIASIILLFMAGLETDLSLFLRFALKGSLVGIGGVAASFFFGFGCGLLIPWVNTAQALFLGIFSVATSVGITARIFSSRQKMDSPEGVTVLAAAVIDDILGIVFLAIIMGVVDLISGDNAQGLDWGKIGLIAVKAISVWIGFTLIGLLASRKIAAFLKLFKNMTAFSILAFGLALLLAGIFEQAGLAMIIGAYVMGLSLSRTDISLVIQEKLRSLHDFLVPIFFVVMGMMVDVQVFLNPHVLVFGLIYSAIVIAGKLIGCGGSSLFLGFNPRGALRIGLGMVPHGEVTLIVAGIGMTAGILNGDVFGMAIMMTMVTALLTPPLLNLALKGKRGTRGKEEKSESEISQFDFPESELTDLMVSRVLRAFDQEGFYLHRRDLENINYQMRRENIFITMTITDTGLTFISSREDTALIKTVVYESLLALDKTVRKLQQVVKKQDMRADIIVKESRIEGNIFRFLQPENIILNIKADEKEAVIEELLDSLIKNGLVQDKETSFQALLEREKQMSTGMQNGIALPHAKTDTVSVLTVAAGLKKEGMDFDSLDKKPSRIFFLVLSPKDVRGPHLQFLSGVGSILKDEKAREALLNSQNKEEFKDYLIKSAKQKEKQRGR